MYIMRIYNETNKIIFKSPININTLICLGDSLSSMKINRKHIGINQYMLNKQEFKLLLLENNIQNHTCLSKNPVDRENCQFNKVIKEIYSVIQEYPNNTKYIIDFR